MTKVLEACLVLCVGAFTLASISTGIPFWIKTVDCNIGLWQTCCRVTTKNGTDYICHGEVDDDKVWKRAVQFLTILSSLFVALSSLFIGLFLKNSASTNNIRGAKITSALGGLGLFSAAVVFGVVNKDFQADFYVSFYLTLTSGASGLLASLLMLILIASPGEYSPIRT